MTKLRVAQRQAANDPRIMNRLSTALLFSLCLGLTAEAVGQNLPAAPTGGLLDDTRALTAEARTELIAEIAICRSAIQADVWFAASTFLPSNQNIRLYAQTLRQHWSAHQNAILLAYDRSSDSHTLSFSPGLWQKYPSAEIIGIMQRTVAIMNEKKQPLEARLTQSLRMALQRLQSLEKERLQSQVTLSKHHTRLAQSFAITMAGGALILGLIGIAIRRRDQKAAWQSSFPDVQVGIRFGAAHGGGVIVQKPPHQAD